MQHSKTFQDPATAPKKLGTEPFIHPTAQIRDSSFGAYCEVGARTKVSECRFGDYSYIVSDADIIYATVGKFCSIAAHSFVRNRLSTGIPRMNCQLGRPGARQSSNAGV